MIDPDFIPLLPVSNHWFRKGDREKLNEIQKAFRKNFNESLAEHTYQRYLKFNKQIRCHVQIAKDMDLPNWMVYELIRIARKRRWNKQQENKKRE